MSARIITALALLVAAPAGAEAADHAHHAGLFAGVAVPEGADAAHPALGLEYEYRLPLAHGLFGLGPIVEVVARSPVQTLAAGALYVHPVGGLKALVAPGYEWAGGHGAFLLRGGLAYDLHLGPVTLSPSVFGDFVSGHLTVVAGAGVGIGF